METKLMDTFWTGYCPECALKGEKVRMRLNSYDLYESEKTGLQIAVFPGVHAIILKTRGLGKFRNTPNFGDETVNGELLSPQTIDRPPFNNDGAIFNEIEEVIDYLKTVK
jgi:hypothetical protein